jgi:hypothetical protein
VQSSLGFFDDLLHLANFLRVLTRLCISQCLRLLSWVVRQSAHLSLNLALYFVNPSCESHFQCLALCQCPHWETIYIPDLGRALFGSPPRSVPSILGKTKVDICTIRDTFKSYGGLFLPEMHQHRRLTIYENKAQRQVCETVQKCIESRNAGFYNS